MQRFSKILFLILFLSNFSGVFAQKYYDTQWGKIHENSKKGTYKSNLPIVLEIQKQAMKENNALQLIRSLRAEFSLINQTTDDEKNDSASRFFVKLRSVEKQLKGDDQLVYKVLLSGFLMDYYNNHSWEIDGRTNINSQDDVAQIETWSKLDFKNYLNKNFKELDQQNQAMKKVALAKYKDVFSNSENISYFPRLQDWYSLKKVSFLSYNGLFTKNELAENRNTINSIFDELVTQNEGNTKLYFMHQKLSENCQFSQCKDKLEQLQSLMKSNIEGDYKVLIAEEIVDELVLKNKEKEAIQFANSIKSQYSKSPFIDNIKNKENQIVNPFLSIKYEEQTQPNLPIHLVAEFKNVTEFSVNIYEVKDNWLSFMQYSKNSYNNTFSKVKKTLVRKEVFQLNDPKDYQLHKTSLEIKPLPSGIYVAEYQVPGVKSDENGSQNFYFLVSNHKIIYHNKSENNQLLNELKLVSSENGKPVLNENLSFYEFLQNETLNKVEGKTDGKGIFKFPATESKQYYRTILVQQPKTNDFQIMQMYGYNNREEYNPNKQTRTKAQVFTDRAIYRPGQTVYFKVINTKIDKEIEGVASGLKQKITLKDANNQEVSVQNFTTNDFGSYHGSFILPKGKLNGNFNLSTDGGTDGYKNLNVEEYKRPKFEVTFEPVKDEYKYGQIIELKGKAMMFSGIALSNTNVNYEIRKQNIRWRYFPWYPNNYENENSILGEAKTNEKGEFTIKLDLKKNERLEGIQIDNYQINASVTDINGETQTANTDLKVASVSHYIKTDNLNNIFAGENVKLKVETKNYNEQNLKKSYQIKLSKLEAPQRIFRNNFKDEVQNLPKLSKEEFISKFPHDLYDKNDQLENWKVSSLILNGDKRNAESLDLGKLDSGDYKLELYNIEGKDTIKSTQNFKVWDKKALQNNQKTFLSVLGPKDEVLRGEKAKIYAYSSVPNALANVFVQNGLGKTVSEVYEFNNGVLEYEIEVPKDKNVNSLNIQFQLVAFNDVQTETINLKIKNSEETLKIETFTFRDKVEPNSKEKWSIKVLGNEKEKVSAEVLANMYDMSLDKFAVNIFDWQKLYNPYSIVTSYGVAQNLEEKYFDKEFPYLMTKYVEVPQFNWFDNSILFNFKQGRGDYSGSYDKIEVIQNVVPEPVRAPKVEMASPRMRKEVMVNDAAIDIIASGRQVSREITKSYVDYDGINDSENINNVPVRQNLNETAFFYPDLKTDSEGNVSFEFTSPEALTKWKLMFLAHTKDARAATLEKEVVTQKEFSVTPNYPRFLREGDELNLQSKLSNLTSKKLNGSAQLQILDAFTNEDISDKFGLSTLTAVSGYNKQQSFSLDENGNSALTWKIKVPNDVSSIILKVVAKAGKYSDGEQKAVAILPNRMLVTDALPIFVKEGETKTFELENLKNATSTTISNVSNTLELTTNPIWEIIFALPSLKNDQNNSADVIFNKWFADVLASEIFKANPKIKTIFEQYQDAEMLNSNLEKNQELKQLLLDETPWVLESRNEVEQMTKFALLFDANTMKNSINQDWDDFKKLQNPDGGFSWYQGYPSSYGTSLYILKNLGKINVWLKDNVKDYQSSEQKELVTKLVQYVDNEINKYSDVKEKNVWTNWTLDYLDTRNYWEKQYPLKANGATLKSLVKQKAKTAKITDFTFFGLHRTALLMNDYGLKDVSDKLLNYLKETSVDSKTQGVYWKQNLDNWGWFGSKVVNQAGALEAFNKLKSNDQKFIEDMKIWLITQKEVNSWGSSRGTSEVIFTILNSGKSWTSIESEAFDFKWGGERIPRVSVVIHHPDYGDKTLSHISGYQKITKNSEEIDKNLATVTVTKPGAGIIQGGLFWQYYEDLDKIKSSENYISVTKELYKKIKTVNGEELQKISPETPLKAGDKVTVRMILNTDRAMEFIHVKDMRAAGFEPLDVISGYQWKNNLGYYQSTKDASTNFYIQSMPKGKYVFEYDYVANASGKFSNGITTIQNYYAPQMNAHTKGTNVEIME
ncbi:alpha-2-macroglobulin family protein [Chryseobacterium luquanense]|uniref:MG2 domain-containing protein n=1 Tax=Chryseobacterium luquanense TaxID=2983766 RepID=A0ABT3XZ27_9FLAO|nr:alpha-2-macroglobulin family protein [Chryseobacterium luquanense]MCX8531163.1 MG2 domain-containing protein [Chryseobacterium luquanense]